MHHSACVDPEGGKAEVIALSNNSWSGVDALTRNVPIIPSVAGHAAGPWRSSVLCCTWPQWKHTIPAKDPRRGKANFMKKGTSFV
ncbi:hypothetical protein Cfor_09300 [Coptotermes formosanus]|uniref:Uncharacterized protein n=1 Tax=Coptotermes formosanus TaxID=36987 RepID=A0A6L2PEF3_COPFO|nr:hypothetical protein Cfor_09300 [Coptotermes formosanus]